MTPAPTPRNPALVPPYAAGPGTPTPALAAAYTAGWDRYEDESANVTYTSPDRRCSLEFGPETARYRHNEDRLWAAAYRPGPRRPGAWLAEFADHTPAEAIAAFVHTVGTVDGIRDSIPGYGAGAGDPEAVFTAAQAAGWMRTARTMSYTGPHGVLHLAFDPAPPYIPEQPLADGPHWQCTYQGREPAREWTALFTAHTPGEAITAFLTALTDPTGLDPDRS
jgi:hypothetical protein